MSMSQLTTIPACGSPELGAIWEQLRIGLASAELTNQSGEPVKCTIADFMLMHIDPDDGSIGFKNRITRNYLYLLSNGILRIPKDDIAFSDIQSRAFHHGYFETFGETE